MSGAELLLIVIVWAFIGFLVWQTKKADKKRRELQEKADQALRDWFDKEALK